MLRGLIRTCVVGGLLLFAATGCGASSAVRAAEGGQLADLGRLLAEEIRRGALDEDEARAVARALAEGEIRRSAPPAGADRLRELRPCARHVEDALLDRAGGADVTAAVAAMILIDTGLADLEERREHADLMARSTDPGIAVAFRAVHARTLLGEGDGAARRERLVDGDEEVRMAALRAAILAGEPGDREAVLEAARLDPNPLARALAIRAASMIGGEAVALALRDLWVLADERAREAIAEAWASPLILDAGGRKQLLWVISTQQGAPAIAAARALARDGEAAAPEAIGVLVRAIESGPTKDRVYAIRAIPLRGEVARAAIARARSDQDDAVAMAALLRDLDEPPNEPARGAAIKRLLKLAEGGATRALQAKGALARAGAREIAPILLRDAKAREPHLREEAGVDLIALGEWARAAPLLADPEPRVRTVVACALLSGR